MANSLAQSVLPSLVEIVRQGRDNYQSALRETALEDRFDPKVGGVEASADYQILKGYFPYCLLYRSFFCLFE
jgi:hypothetical protein